MTHETRSSEALALREEALALWDSDPARAASLIDRAVRLVPDDPRLLYDQARACFARGDLPGAASACERVLAAQPAHPRALTALANAQLAMGRPGAAVPLYEQASRLRPDIAEPHNNRGVALQQLGRLQDAFDAFRAAVEAEPSHVDAHDNLARAALDLEDLPRLRGAYRRLAAAAPGVCEVAFRRGRLALGVGDLGEAVASLLEAVNADPDRVDARLELCKALVATGRFEEARAQLSRIVEEDPTNAVAHYLYGTVLSMPAIDPRSETHLRRAAELKPDLAPAHLGLAGHLLVTERLEEAREILQAVAERYPEDVGARGHLAEALDRQRDREGALAALEPFLRAGRSEVALSYSQLARTDEERRRAVDLVRAELASARGNVGYRRHLHFGLARLLDRLGRDSEAFSAAREANRLKPVRYDPASFEEQVSRLVDTFSAEAWPDLPRASTRADEVVFVVGMPRSGTTLTEQILDRHPDVVGGGEMSALPGECAGLGRRAGVSAPWPEVMRSVSPRHLEEAAASYRQSLPAREGARYATDKLPHNFNKIGWIALALPGARIVHCVRDWRDTCLSLYFNDFAGHHAYAYDLAHLGHYHRWYERLMAHWRDTLGIPLIEVRYEDLVTDQEATTRRLLAELDLEWDPRCLAFHESDRVVFTASHQQVREPLYSRSLGRWTRYERWLEPLFEAYEEAG